MTSYAASCYSQPQLAGGINTSANVYTAFLRRLLVRIRSPAASSNAHARCTNPQTCASAIETPFPTTESPNYSIGHWVEDTSSPMAPIRARRLWLSTRGIEPTKAYYGVLVRAVLVSRPALDSVACGRKLRLAGHRGGILTATQP